MAFDFLLKITKKKKKPTNKQTKKHKGIQVFSIFLVFEY